MEEEYGKSRLDRVKKALTEGKDPLEALYPEELRKMYKKASKTLTRLKRAVRRAIDACEIEHDHSKAAQILKGGLGEDPVWRDRQGEDPGRVPFREREYTWDLAETPPMCPECGAAMERRADGPVADWHCQDGHPPVSLQEPGDERRY